LNKQKANGEIPQPFLFISFLFGCRLGLGSLVAVGSGLVQAVSGSVRSDCVLLRDSYITPPFYGFLPLFWVNKLGLCNH
jgi:hypothetical protein